jgi:C4-dicarboxylate-specific signal transduction histidine kinase
VAILTVTAAAFVANRIASQEFERTTNRAISTAARRAAASVDLFLRERQASVALLATTPTVVDHARAAGNQAQVMGLDRTPTAELEAQYENGRVLGSDERVNRFLERVRDDSDFAELFFTDRHGLIAAASNPTSDFVQSDEAWWQRALASGSDQDAAEYDESAGTEAVGLAARIEDPVSGDPVGILKAVLDLSRLSRVLAIPADTSVITVQVVDSAGRIVAASAVAAVAGRPGHPAGGADRRYHTSAPGGASGTRRFDSGERWTMVGSYEGTGNGFADRPRGPQNRNPRLRSCSR